LLISAARNNPTVLALARCALSAALEMQGRYRESLTAVAMYETAESQAKLDPEAICSLRVQIGLAYNYSGDHPKMYADFDPALSPWINYPAELKRKGWIGICATFAAECLAKLDALDPNAEKLEVSVTRQIGNVKGDTMIFALRISASAK